jgi:DNA-binding transcriptional ArsR family regulator
MVKRMKQVQKISGSQQLHAMTSPLRLEIIGQFTSGQPLSVREIAERIGRPPSGIHYHIGLLERAGLIVRAGERRVGRRNEALYRPSAARFELASGGRERDDAALKAMSSAFRMAERDMEAALRQSSANHDGDQRTFHAMRVHLRLSPSDLKKLNTQLDRLMKIVYDVSAREEIPDSATEFCSLTLALLPLRDRDKQTP